MLVDILRCALLFLLAVSTDMAQWYTKNLLDFYENDQEKLDGVMFANAMKLFPRLKVLP